MDIFKLVGSVFVDTEEANKSLAKTDEKAEGLGKKFLSGAGTVAKWGAAAVGAAAAVGTAMVASAADTASNLDVIDKASQRMGVSAESYQELAHAAGLCGVEMSTMEKAAKKLEGSDISFDDAIASIYELGTAEERSAKAAELFGESVAYQMSPMLNATAEEMANMRQEANDLGLVMSEDAVKDGAALNDALSNVKDSFSAIASKIGVAIIPIVKKVADLIIDNMPEIQKMFDGLTPVLVGLADAIMPVLTELIDMLLPVLVDILGSIIPIFNELIASLLPPILQIIKMLLPPLLQIIDAILPLLYPILEAITPLLDVLIQLLQPILDIAVAILIPLVELISKILPSFADVIKMLCNIALKPLIKVVNVVAEVLQVTLASAFEALMPIIDAAERYFGGLIDFITGVFTGDWQKAWQGVQDIFGGIFEGLKELIKAPLNYVISCINKVFDAVGTISIPDWVPVIGGSSFSLPQLPALAEGGDITRGGAVLVGEQGPEFLNLPQGARVTPLDKANMADNSLMEEMLSVMKAMKEEIANMQIVLDSGVMVGQMAPAIDNELGNIYKKNARWTY